MTGFLNTGGEPLSVMTIRSFEDLDYTVNTAAADAYTIAIGSLSAGSGPLPAVLASGAWERPLGVPVKALPTVGLNFRRER
jgi:hypothetical protein